MRGRVAGGGSVSRCGCAPTTVSAYRSLLSNSRLTWLFLDEGISAVGDWLYFVAMLVIVYDVAQDPFLLGLIGAARIVPYAVLWVPAGCSPTASTDARSCW